MKTYRRIKRVLVMLLAVGFVLSHAAIASDFGATATPTPTPGGSMIGGTEPLPEEDAEPSHPVMVGGEDKYVTYETLEVMKTDGTKGFGGYWADPAREPEAIFVGVTKDADRNKILARIPESWKGKIRFVEARYTYAELWDTYQEIFQQYMLSICDENYRVIYPDKQVLVSVGMSEKEGCVGVGILKTLSKERQDEVIAELFEKYGDRIIIVMEDPADFSDDNKEVIREKVGTSIFGGELSNQTGMIPVGKNAIRMTYADYKKQNGSGRNYVLWIAVLGALAACAAVIFYVFRMRNRRVYATVNGQTFAEGAGAEGSIENLARKAAEDVSEEGRDRIFAAYEKECGEK